MLRLISISDIRKYGDLTARPFSIENKHLIDLYITNEKIITSRSRKAIICDVIFTLKTNRLSDCVENKTDPECDPIVIINASIAGNKEKIKQIIESIGGRNVKSRKGLFYEFEIDFPEIIDVASNE